MASLTTILRLAQGLVVALLVALAGGSQGGAACDALQAGQIAVAQAAVSSGAPTTLPRTWRVNHPPTTRDPAVSELEADEELEGGEEREGGEKGSPASTRPSGRIELQSRSKDVARNRRAIAISVVVSHWMPAGHPRGPPA